MPTHPLCTCPVEQSPLTLLRFSLSCRYTSPSLFQGSNLWSPQSLTALPTSLPISSLSGRSAQNRVGVRALSATHFWTHHFWAVCREAGQENRDRRTFPKVQRCSDVCDFFSLSNPSGLWRQAQYSTNELSAYFRVPGEESLTGMRWVASLQQCRCARYIPHHLRRLTSSPSMSCLSSNYGQRLGGNTLIRMQDLGWTDHAQHD